MKTKKKKIGSMKIKNTGIKFAQKPIWMWIENSHWTNERNTYVLNINFKNDETDYMYMLIDKLYDNKLFPEYLTIRDVNMNIDFGDGRSKYKTYYKIFINIPADDEKLKEVINILTDKVIRSVTTYKSKIDENKIGDLKLQAVAELI